MTMIRRIFAISILVCTLSLASPVQADSDDMLPKLEYKIFRLPKPYMILDAGDMRLATYDLEGFKLLLAMDADFHHVTENLATSRVQVEALSKKLAARATQVSNGQEQLKLCTVDRTRITSKWKRTEAAKNKAEAKRRGGLFAITGWTLAGVSVSVSIGLLIGLLVQ